MTLIETLVVISVVALVAALVLPAVVSIRESQRRQVCASRLQELGRALQSFEGIYRVYPSGMASETIVSYKPGKSKPRWISPQVRLLPYLDQSVLFEQIDFSPTRPFIPAYDVAVASDVGGKEKKISIQEMRLPIFLCPSDSPAYADKTFSNYRANMGRGPGSGYKAADSVVDPSMVVANGAFVLGTSLTSGDFTDGMAHTVAFSERVRGNGDPTRYSSERDMFFTGMTNIQSGGWTLDEWRSACTDPVTSTEFYPYCGGSWFYAGYAYTWYNHALTPNSKISDCSMEGHSTRQGPLTTYALMAARSLHSGGVNCVFMDGHCSFLSNSIDQQVWWALASRNGAEVRDVTY